MDTHVATLVSAYTPLSYQDRGRCNWRRFGVPVSGVMDKESAKFANLMVDNYGDEVVIEFSYGGLVIDFFEPVIIAVVGAGGLNQTLQLSAGEQLTIKMEDRYVWGYIAIHKGWCTTEVLGSSSFHARSALGDALSVGSTLYAKQSNYHRNTRGVREHDIGSLDVSKKVRVARGPHVEVLGWADFFEVQRWNVSQRLDRTGYCLEGEKRPHSLSLKSFPVLPGCIQVTPSGLAIVTMPDGPTVGGYPVIAMVHPDDLGLLAQRGVGKSIEFEWYDLDKL